MNSPLIIGAGACKTPASILPYMRDDGNVGAVSTGSYTPEFSSGNAGPVLFWPDNLADFLRDGIGDNSLGMPNMGCDAAATELKSYAFSVPVIASVAAFLVDGYVAGIKTFDDVLCVSAIKANFGCPNRHDMKPVPIAYDLESVFLILEAIKQLQLKKPLWLKLSPYLTDGQRYKLQKTYPKIDFSNVPTVEPGYLGKIMSLISQYQQFVRAIVFSNTLPNVIIRDASGRPVTSPNDGKAGLSGSILKPISIGLIREARKMLPDSIDMIGSGGVIHGDDAADYLEPGDAKAVCITSLPFWSGNDPRVPTGLIVESERLQTYLMQHTTEGETHAN